ncbi:hypothetical protein LLG95_01275, partial [bacterium]|nr:hypothetical protein [bacterium]
AGGAVAGCRAEANGGAGVQGSGSFTDCVVYGNGTGLSLTGTATRCYIAENLGDGVDGGTVVDSVVAGNKGQGIDTPAGISGSYIVGNLSHGVFNVSNTGQMHGCYLDDNGSGFDYCDTRLSTALPVVNLTGNYWGPVTTPVMDAHPWGTNFNISRIRDFWDDYTLTEANYGGHLAAPPGSTNAPAFLLSVTPNTKSAVGVGQTTFTLTYNRPMNTAVNPSVTFGRTLPYATYIVEPHPGWINPTTWQGVFAVQSDTINGTHTLRVTGPRAANGFVLPDDVSHPFIVDTSGGGSANNGIATALGSTRMSLNWSEAGRSPTAIGYNVLRSMSGMAGTFTRVNASPVPTPAYTDTGLASGQLYFYVVDVVEADNSATQWTPPFYGITTGGTLPLVQFAVSSSMANENGGVARLSLTMSQSSSVPVTVQYQVGGTATAGSDYVAPAGSVTFNAGQIERQIDLTILEDTAIEPDETVVLTLTGATNANLGDRSVHTLTIVDDDCPAVSFLAPTATAQESSGTVNCTLALSDPISKSVTVQYSVGGNATGSGVDFDSLSGIATFAPNETQKSIPVHIIDDTAVELDETIVLTLTGAVNATPLGTTQHTLVIQDNDPPIVGFSSAASSVGEGGGTARVAVTLSARTNRTVTVTYSTGGTAQGGGVDFTTPGGTVVFNPTETTRYIDLPIIDDGEIEPAETVVLTLTGAAGGVIGTPSQHTLTIDDNDTPVVVFSDFFSTANENAGWTTITLQLSHAAYQPVDVYYSAGGTAQGGGVDYDTPPGVVTFAPLETVKRIPIHLIDDALAEADKGLVFTINSSANATIGSPSQHTLIIYDDDQQTSRAIVSFATGQSTVAEDDGIATVTLHLTRRPGDTSTVTAHYAVSGTAAGGGIDFSLPTGNAVTFESGATTRSIVVTILNDALFEPDETVQLTLTSADNGAPGGIVQHTLTIIDDDRPRSAVRRNWELYR